MRNGFRDQSIRLLTPHLIIGLGDCALIAAVWAGRVDLNAAAAYLQAQGHLSVDGTLNVNSHRPNNPELYIDTEDSGGLSIANTLESSDVELAVLMTGPDEIRASLREHFRQHGLRSIDGVEASRRHTWQELYRWAAALFIAGVELDLTIAGPMSRGRRIALPASPMNRRRHWIGSTASRTPRQPGDATQLDLPGRELALPMLQERRFAMPFSRDMPSYANDHRLFGTMVIPGASHVAMTLAAAAHLTSGPVTMTDAMFLHPFILGDNATRDAQLILRPEGNGWSASLTAAQHLSADKRDIEWTEIFRASLASQPNPTVDLLTPHKVSEIQQRCSESMSGERFYHDVWVPGLDTGGSFHWLDAIWRGDNEALALTRRPPGVTSGTEPIHPGLVEAAFQLLNSCWEYDTETLRQTGEIYVPYSIDRYDFRGGLTEDRLWVHAEVAAHTRDDETFSARVKMYAPDGQMVIRVEGFTARKISNNRVKELLDAGQTLPLHTLGWQPSTLSAPVTAKDVLAVLVSSSGQDLARCGQALNIRGVDTIDVLVSTTTQGDSTTYTVDSNAFTDLPAALLASARGRAITDIVDLRALHIKSVTVREVAALSTALLDTVQPVLPNEGTEPRLWWVTARAQMVGETSADGQDLTGSAAWGLASGVRSEMPELRCTTVDIESVTNDDLDLLAAELHSASDELRIAYRAGQRYVARIRPYAAPTPPNDPVIKADRTYLITGGTSGVGLAMASWLVQHGANHLVLLSRRRPAESEAALIAQLERGGCTLTAGEVDITAANAATRIQQILTEHGQPLGGVVHAAGVLDDATIPQLSVQSFETVLNPKLQGLQALEELITHNCYEPDFVILLSSTTALLSAAGQSNYAAANSYLDAAAYRMRALGIPATSIAWGPWSQVGMAARLTENQRTRSHTLGISSIDTHIGLSTFGRLLRSEAANVIAAQINWTALRESLGRLARDPVLDMVASSSVTTPENAGSLRDRISMIAVAERLDAIQAMLESLVRQSQGLSSSTQLDPDRGFVELGLDSMILIDLRAKLQDGFGIRLSATFGFDYPTIRSAAAHLATLLEPSESPANTKLTGPLTEHGAASAPETAASNLNPIDEELALLEETISNERRAPQRGANGL